jgi:outer membrane protein assembly factor BamB
MGTKMKKAFAIMACFVIVLSSALISPVQSESKQNSGKTDETAVTQTVLWDHLTNGVAHVITINEGVLYLSTRNGTICALNFARGNVLWSFNAYSNLTPQEITSHVPFAPTLSLSDGVVYVSSIKNFYALNATDGVKLWGSYAGPFAYTNPCVADGVVFIGSANNVVYALNASNGIQLWHCILGSSFWMIRSNPVFSEGVVYIGSNDGCVYAIDATTGKMLWYYNTGGYVGGTAKVGDGVVYIGGNNGFFALNATDGSNLNISIDIVSNILGSPPTIVGDQEIIVNSTRYANVLFSRAVSNGSLLWSTNIACIAADPLILGGSIFIACAGVNGDVLYAFDASDGVQLVRYPLWSNSNGGINIVLFYYDDGLLLVQPFEGDLYAYNITSLLPSNAYLSLSILSPENQKYSEPTVPLVFALNNNLDWATYSLDGQQNITAAQNTTITKIPNGLHAVTVYANDTYGNVASQTVLFTVQKPAPFPTIPLIAAVSVVAVVVVASVSLLIYRKRKNKFFGFR